MIKKNTHLINLLLTVALGIVVFISIFNKQPQIVEVPGKKTLEKRIEHTKELVPIYLKANGTDKKQIVALGNTIDGLAHELSIAKNRRDTVIILKTQDSLIASLLTQGVLKDSVISRLETAVDLQDQTIKNQDTLLQIRIAEVKKYKRQRNITTAVATIFGGFLILL
jgi:hypothetical protein